MADLEALRIQTYSTNLEALLQQKQAKFRQYARQENAAGAKAHRFLSQIDKVTPVRRTGPAELIDNQAATFTARWVMAPLPWHFDKIIDKIETVQTNIEPGGALVEAAVMGLNRFDDDDFLSAYFGDAKTGETGSGTTTFGSGVTDSAVIAVDTGVGSATGLNIDKLDAALELFMGNEVDLDMERPIIAISPKQHRDLKALTKVTSGDFTRKYVLDGDGMVREFNGFKIVVSNRLPIDGNSYRRCPVWVPSGMGCATWFDIKADIRNLPNYKGNPFLVEAESMRAYTRLEEGRCLEIKCAEA